MPVPDTESWSENDEAAAQALEGEVDSPVAFLDCTCDHPAAQHGWTHCDVPGCPCEGRWEE